MAAGRSHPCQALPKQPGQEALELHHDHPTDALLRGRIDEDTGESSRERSGARRQCSPVLPTRRPHTGEIPEPRWFLSTGAGAAIVKLDSPPSLVGTVGFEGKLRASRVLDHCVVMVNKKGGVFQPRQASNP